MRKNEANKSSFFKAKDKKFKAVVFLVAVKDRSWLQTSGGHVQISASLELLLLLLSLLLSLL